MKTTKLILSRLASCILLLFLVGTITSCGTKSQKETEHNEETEQHEGGGEADHKMKSEEGHHDNAPEEDASESMMWMPGDQPFTGMLKLVQGDEAKLTPSITSGNDGSKVLNLTLTGNKTILLFDGVFNNVGANLQFKTEDFRGEVALVHHYTDASNYDYVSISNSAMQLGRMENGKNNVLNKEDKKMPLDWATLSVSSAGEHYKGLLNEKQVNHGHGDVRAAGQVGVLLNGKGKVMLKMLDVMKLSE